MLLRERASRASHLRVRLRRPASVRARDRSCGRAGRTRRGRIPSRGRCASARRTPPACSSATIGRFASDGRRYWPIVTIWQPAPRDPAASRRPRPTPRRGRPSGPTWSGWPARSRAIGRARRARAVASARPRHAVEARHRLDVVIEHVGPRVEHDPQRRFVALEIGNQHFEPARRNARARLRDRPREMRRAEVRQVVAIDRGDDDVARARARGWRSPP